MQNFVRVFIKQFGHFAARVDKTFIRGWRFVRKHKGAVVVWGIGAFFLLMGFFFLWAATLRLPDLAALSQIKIDQSVKIYDRTGQVLLYDLNNKNIRRTSVPLEAISPIVQDAVISIEDPKFYEHNGVEFTAIARAIYVDITQGHLEQGGSTITQQVLKNTVLTNDKSIARKLKEWVLALKLERVLNKKQILELYLNQIPFGGTMYGIEEVSETFFGKHASEVTLPEAAYLAAMLPAPSYYSPYGNHKDALDARKNIVLQKMFDHGYITQQELDAAKLAVVTFVPQRDTTIQAPHFVFYVQQYLENKYGEDALQTSGWKVTTSLDADLQVKAEEIVNENALANTEKFNASNAGMVALDPKTGQILVMVGSRNYFDNQIDGAYNVTLADRQPGSAFKPFAYAQAFSEGYTPDTVVFDVPTQFQTTCAPTNFTSDGDCYSPKNYDNKFRGPMTMREAIAQSINVPSVKVLYLAGIADTLQLAKSMGISTLGDSNQYGLTLVLGGGEVTLLDITSAYGAFANNGIHYSPTAILKIEDSRSNVIEDNTNAAGSQVLDPQVAQEINDVLSDPVARGPLGENNLFTFSQDVAVKTGTTNDYRDAWTIGYSTNIVVGVWAGNNDNSSMIKRVSGFIVGPMWSQFMHYALAKVPTGAFTRTTVDESNLKPVLRGVWQNPGTDGQLHEILYWLNKNDPTGITPPDLGDSQFNAWETGLHLWAAQNGVSAGAAAPQPSSAASPTSPFYSPPVNTNQQLHGAQQPTQ
ncbi:MAG: PBP1A family penicillin-binding protein [bacterium]|nr:PBP1A family penicillin-binding protein [bacterium]